MAMFKDLQDVNLFIWNWIASFESATRQFVTATKSVANKVFIASATMLDNWRAVQVPWYNQVIAVFNELLTYVLGNTIAPIRSAVEKLNEARADVHTKTLDATDKTINTSKGLVSSVISPFVDLVGRIRSYLLVIRGVANTVANAGDVAHYAGKVENAGAFASTAARTDVLAQWVNHIVDEDGMLQPATLLRSAAGYRESLFAVAINAGIVGNPAKDMEKLNEKYPLLTFGELAKKAKSGELLGSKAVTAVVESFKEQLAAE